MRGKRRKIHRRTLRYFKVNFGLSPPFKVIVDGNFAFATHEKKLPVQEYLNRILETEQTTLCTTGAILNELNKLKGEVSKSATSEKLEILEGAYQFSLHLLKLKVFQRGKSDKKSLKRKRNAVDDETSAEGTRNTGEVQTAEDTSGEIIADSQGSEEDKSESSEDTSNQKEEGRKENGSNQFEPLTAADSILKVIGNNNRGKYIVATQDESLKEKLRRIPGVPIISLCRTMLLMDTPSDVSKETVESTEQKKLAPSKTDRRFLTELYAREKKSIRDSDLTAAEAAGAKDKSEEEKRKGPSKKFLRKLRRQEREKERRKEKYLATQEAAEKKSKKTRSRKRRKKVTSDSQ